MKHEIRSTKSETNSKIAFLKFKTSDFVLRASCLLLLGLCCSAHASETRSLDRFLEDLRKQGVKIIYSSALITPEMKAETDPPGATPQERLQNVLRPYGLSSLLSPSGNVLVIRTPAPSGPVGVVSHIKVLSDKIEDVSSMEAWRKSFIKPGMTQEQIALAIWNSVVKFRHQDSPPQEFLTAEGADVHDALKIFNVYGYGMCCCSSSHIEELGRYVGFNARGWALNAHSVPELFYDGSWHLLDSSLIAHYPRADGSVAGVEDLIADITAWLAKNPGFEKNVDKLGAFMRNNGWKKGPEILAHSNFYDINGWLPASTHGWYSTMQEFDGSAGKEEKAFVYDYGYSQGYEVNIELRHGERITRNWFNKGLHINMDGAGGAPGCIAAKIGKEDMRYAVAYGDLAPGRIGNGTIEYDVPLASGTFRAGALTAENLASAAEDHAAPAVHVKDPASPGVLVLRMPSSYVYLGGELNFKASVGDGGEIALAISTNNGLDWTDLTRVKASVEQRVDLKPFIFRRYDYRLRFTLKGSGTGLEALKISNDIQHSQRALPALDKGRNTISFSAGLPEGTITIEGSTVPAHKTQQLVYTDFHPIVVGLENPLLHITGNKGSITFPVTTPGELTRLRFGGHYRARDDKYDAWDMQVSLDNGKTFKNVDRAAGPTGHGSSKYATFSEIPTGIHEALVRWDGVQRNTTLLQSFRIDADYTEPHGGFAKVKVTYQWEENGQPKQDVHIARNPSETYAIDCSEKPLMKSITFELAE
jgi:hypothetical protein